MENKHSSIVNEEMDIFFNRFDKNVKVGAIKLTNADLGSESNFIKTLQKATANFEDKTYTLNHGDGLFARFDIENKTIKLHLRSENTGIILPCWNYINK